MTKKDVEIHVGNGNVFADLGVPQADDMLLRSKIVVELRRLMASRALSQTATAKLVGMGQADLSKMLSGNLRGYSVERLMRMLTAFDQDVDIISRSREKGGGGEISFIPAQV